MKNSQQGFTLLEVSVAVAIFSIVGLLSFIVLSSSNESAAMAGAKSDVQASLRDTMNALTTEVQSAFTERLAGTPGADPVAQPITLINNGTGLRYHVPDPNKIWGAHTIPGASTPIQITFENEDANGNGILDTGEDLNADGVLNRRLVRTHNGVTTILGGANEIEAVTFELLPHPAPNNNALTRLNIELVASKQYGPSKDKRVWAELSTMVNLEN